MTAQLCWENYERPTGAVIHCTYLADHPVDRHSWFAARWQDEADAGKVDYTPKAVQAMLDALVDGSLDDYVEAILAAGHHRKRIKRGVKHDFRLTE